MVRSKKYLILLCFLSTSMKTTRAEQGIVRDGTMTAWFHKAYSTSDKAGALWTNPKKSEDTFSQTESNDEVNGYWLITNYVTLKNLTQLIYVDVEAQITRPTSSSARYFEVFIYYGDKNPNYPKESQDRVKIKEFLLSNFTFLHNITLSSIMKKENRTFKFHSNGSDVTFGIRARGVSGSLYRMKMYYYYCEEMFLNSVRLLKTISLPRNSIAVSLNCSKNSTPANNETLRAFCQSNGTWNVDNSTKCFCHKGYAPADGCKRCLNGHYKSKRSNDKCLQCPPHSTNNSANTACQCERNYYRLPCQEKHVAPRCYGLPSRVEKLKSKKGNSSGTVILTWNPPSKFGGLPDNLTYDVECYLCTDREENCVNATTCSGVSYSPGHKNISQTEIRISGLKPGRSYRLKVFSKNSVSNPGNKHFWNSEEKIVPVDPVEAEEGLGLTKLHIIAAALAVTVILVLLIVLVFILRCRHKDKRRRSATNLTDYGVSLPMDGQKMYIDPSNYDDPEYAIKEFGNEVDPSSLSLECVIGGGEFGDVYKGTLTRPDDTVITVAAKTLKPDSTEKSRRDFFLEASAMVQFDDPNVIHLEGVITKVLPKMIITEYMSNGSLDNFLKGNEDKLTTLQLLGMARGVASGMKYLAQMHFVHRDLAARNILVNETLFCKVADFGLSRKLETEDSSTGEYLTQGGRIPVRWTAPEAIKYRKFSAASDVWSYGILLWEIMSFGERPYWDWDNFKVIERVEEGFRLPLPLNCPSAVHSLMLKCWETDRDQRPLFKQIVKIIDEWIRSPETINNGQLQLRKSFIPDLESSTSVKEWLETIKMSSYMPYFTAAGYKELADLAGLLEGDLKEMGITLVGHRNKMLRTIRSLPVDPDQKRTKSVKKPPKI